MSVFPVPGGSSDSYKRWWRVQAHICTLCNGIRSAILYSSFQFSRTSLQCNTYSRLHTDARGAKMGFNLGGGNFTWSNYFLFSLFSLSLFAPSPFSRCHQSSEREHIHIHSPPTHLSSTIVYRYQKFEAENSMLH